MTRCLGGYGQAEEVVTCIKEAHPHDAAGHVYMGPSLILICLIFHMLPLTLSEIRMLA